MTPSKDDDKKSIWQQVHEVPSYAWKTAGATLVFGISLFVWTLCSEHLGDTVKDIAGDPMKMVALACLAILFVGATALSTAYFQRGLVKQKFDSDFATLNLITKQLGDSAENVKRMAQINELRRVGERWLYSDEEAKELESFVDKTVVAVVPNLFYEIDQEEWRDVIANNLAKTPPVEYTYLLLDNPENVIHLDYLREELAIKLTKKNIPDAGSLVIKNFKTILLSINEFPHIVFNGFAIYRFANHARDSCLLYFPQELWEWNVNLLAGSDPEAKRKATLAVAYAEAQIKQIAESHQSNASGTSKTARKKK